jgi:endo-1,3(4)-beta-glucanase
LGFGATEGIASRKITSFDLFSVNIQMTSGQGSIDFPMVRGMAYVTAIYNRLTPVVFTQHAILSVNGAPVGSAPFYGNKFKLVLNNGQTWLVYFINNDGSLPSLTMYYRVGEGGTQQLYTNTPYSGIANIPASQ